MDEADGLIERSLAERIARVPRGADDLEILRDRARRREDDHVRARHHDLPRRPLRELEDAFDDLAVFLGEDAGLLRAGQEQPQLFLRVADLPSPAGGTPMSLQDARSTVSFRTRWPDR